MVLKRVGVGSAAKISAALYAAIGFIAGAMFALFSLLGAGLSSMAGDSDMPAFIGALFGVGAIVFLPILYGAMGACVGAIGAAIYNLVAGAVGGLEVDLG
jgi:hypothetical protein